MKSFQACLLVLATATNALVLPEIAKRDECTPGLYQCQADGQHWQQCTAGKVWAPMMSVAPGTTCNPGISENPFIPVGSGSTPPTNSPPAASPPAASPPAASPSAAQPTVVPTTAAPTKPITESPPPPPAASPPAASPPAASPPASSDSTTVVTTQQTSSTTTLATVTATAGSGVTDSPPPPPPAATTTSPPAVTTSTPPPSAATSATTIISDSPPPPPSATDNPNAGTGPTVDQVCIDFTSDNPAWTYALQNPWGSSSGTFGDLPNGKLCVPTSDSAGGAMYIGSKPNPGPGNTKLECYFPKTGTANCDNSLVDGYSLSVKCTAGDAVIGSSLDLWKQDGITCKDKAPGGICLNKLAYLQSESAVDNFFQQAGREKNCIWWACNQDYFFPVTTTVSCHVSGSVPKDP